MKAVKNLFGIVGFSLAILFVEANISTFGQPTTTVLVGSGGLKFVPATASIPVNGSVIWSWASSPHSTTSGNGTTGTPNNLWDSGVNGNPHFFTNTFNSAGNFPYYCSVHYPEGMLGEIDVTNPVVVVPPTVTITNPASGAVLSAPASLTLAAGASVSSGSITNVQFLQGAVSLGNVASAPFTLAVNNLSAADYTFTAIATADSGLTATNSISVDVINPSPLVISAPAVATPGQFRFSYASDVGLTYVVQVSTNLSAGWTSIATNTATTNPTVFTDTQANPAGAFYQVLRLPNP